MKCFGLMLLVLVHASAGAEMTLGFEAGTYPTIGFYFASRPVGRLGWYGDIKGSLPLVNDDDTYKFNANYAELVLNDRYEKSIRSLGYFDLGATVTLFDAIDAFLAVGLGSATKYRRYYDRFGILGEGGHYYIEKKNSILLNLQPGLLFYLNRVSFKVSFDVGAPSLNLGIGFVF